MRDRVGALIIRDKKLLLVSTSGDWFWTPGGKIENDETPEQTLARELLEELNIQATNMQLFNTYEINAGESIAGYKTIGGTESNYLVEVSPEKEIKPLAEIKFVGWYNGPEALAAPVLQSFKTEVIQKLVDQKIL